MKVLIDTNIIIDILEQRKPYFHDSYRVIQLGLNGGLGTIMSAGAVTDVYYIIKQSLHDTQKAKEKIYVLASLVAICHTTSNDIKAALALSIGDFENAVVSAIAKREKADFIITKNEKDFSQSPVPAINPRQFLRNFKGAAVPFTSQRPVFSK